MHHAPGDEPHRTTAVVEWVEGQHHRRDREDHESHVVDANPSVHIAEPAEQHDKNRGGQQVSHEHPQQVTHVPGRKRIEADATENRGQRDQDDG
ncbi:Uncharacterised protein [Mycobacteroides abscessus subsp. massiliense]|nr:Uncharacterised protein [Mycobacteroides abscessus subsp. massiliense]